MDSQCVLNLVRHGEACYVLLPASAREDRSTPGRDMGACNVLRTERDHVARGECGSPGASVQCTTLLLECRAWVCLGASAHDARWGHPGGNRRQKALNCNARPESSVGVASAQASGGCAHVRECVAVAEAALERECAGVGSMVKHAEASRLQM